MKRSDKLFHFQIGELLVCAEHSQGYAAPDMPSSVALSVRERSPKGKIGARKALSVYVKPNEIAAIGIEFLSLANRMAPETLFARSETVASTGPQQKPVKHMLQEEAREIADALDQGRLTIDKPLASFEKLRQRIHILQRAQHLLERLDDDAACQLELLLTVMEQYGGLRFAIGVAPEPIAGISESRPEELH
ncbi:hypothetical protein [Achromobacter sp. DH1f]|uniref:hypothetical protein n=1 Tax=Achromobacter sp. DH1f TaxID=1397275 RepID=UPI0012FECD10|nr:hypothetical protein [Achromobacter sp. DH1f]